MFRANSEQIDEQQQGQTDTPSFVRSVADTILSVPFSHACSEHAFITGVPYWLATPCGAFLMVEITVHHDGNSTRLDVRATCTQTNSQPSTDAVDDDDTCDYLD